MTSPKEGVPMHRQALGKGLEALLGSVDTATGTLREIPLEEISPNPYQPRTVFDDGDLASLAGSIRRQGVLQPVTVRLRAEGPGYELIAGERRWRAARLAGIATIPALVRQTEPVESLELALVENLQRRDLSPVEAAQAYQRLISEFRLTQEEVARRVGKDRSSVANTIRLLNLPMEVQDHLQAERITLGHAKVLLGAGTADVQSRLARRVILERLSVRQLEAVLARARQGPAQAPPAPPEVAEAETRLARHLGTRVRLREGKRSGRIEIRYGGRQERERLMALLLGF
jgi:ParB family chromosome partitioning protein